MSASPPNSRLLVASLAPLAVAWVAALATACAGFEAVPPPIEHPDGGCSLCDSARDKRSSVVRIETPAGSGTGTVVDQRGRILTNAHVVRGRHTIWIETHEGQLVQGRVVRSLPREDLALIQADAPWLLWRPIELADGRPPVAGSFATVIGFPGQQGWMVAHGEITGFREPGEVGPVGFLESDVPILPGGSGGPLLDARGRLIGLMTGRQRGVEDGPSFALPAAALRRFLENSP